MAPSGFWDLESTCLSALGFSHLLDYVIDPLDPLYAYPPSGQIKRNLLQNNIDGGTYV